MTRPRFQVAAEYEPMPAPSGAARAWVAFWFAPVSPVALHTLRAGSALLFLVWLLSALGHVEALFGLNGWFDSQAYRETAQWLRANAAGDQVLHRPQGPIGWSLLYLCGDNTAALHLTCGVSIGVVVLFLAGVATRLTAVANWTVVASFTANPSICDPSDWLLTAPAFYLMLGYLGLGQWGRPQSVLSRLAGPVRPFAWGVGEPEPASHAANFALRLCQVHLALMLVMGGLRKLQFGEWWSGVGLWYALHPPFATSPQELQAIASQSSRYLVQLSVASYALLAWQLLFPLFAWRRGLGRLVLLGGASIGVMAGVAVQENPFQGASLLVACLCFVTPAEWQRLVGLARLVRPRAFSRKNAPTGAAA